MISLKLMEFTFFVDNAGSISPSIEHFHRHILRIVPNIIIHEICFHSLNFNLHDLSNVILRLCISFVQVQRQTEVPTRKRGSRSTDSGKMLTLFQWQPLDLDDSQLALHFTFHGHGFYQIVFQLFMYM